MRTFGFPATTGALGAVLNVITPSMTLRSIVSVPSSDLPVYCVAVPTV